VQHPRDGRRLEFEAPMPTDLDQLLKQLRRPVSPTAMRPKA